MAVSNSLIGARVYSAGDRVTTPQPGPRVAPDGTEWAVATLVVAALGVLVLFRLAGFQAVIAASVGK